LIDTTGLKEAHPDSITVSVEIENGDVLEDKMSKQAKLVLNGYPIYQSFGGFIGTTEQSNKTVSHTIEFPESMEALP